ncbi:MAG: hypothetical protein JXA33_03180 [Anaerolineae bacterium]|nr:hypothetical protein [Anaerolineae bacterium]
MRVLAPFPRFLSNRLQIQHLRDFVLRREASGDGAQAQTRGKVAAAPVQLRQQHRRAEVERGQIHQQRRRLPLRRRQPRRVRQRRDLRDERLLRVNLALDVHHPFHVLAGEGSDLRQVRGGEGVGEVEN